MKYHTELMVTVRELRGSSVRRYYNHASGQKASKSYPIEIAHIPTHRGRIMLAYCLVEDELYVADDAFFQKSKYPDTVMEFSL